MKSSHVLVSFLAVVMCMTPSTLGQYSPVLSEFLHSNYQAKQPQPYPSGTSRQFWQLVHRQELPTMKRTVETSPNTVLQFVNTYLHNKADNEGIAAASVAAGGVHPYLVQKLLNQGRR